jgi:hypothetical protein
MASKPEPERVRKARETLAATEKLSGKAYTDAFGSDEVQAALETINGDRHERAGGDLGETPLREAIDAGVAEGDAA